MQRRGSMSNLLGLSDAEAARVASGGEVAQWLLQRAEEVITRVSNEASYAKTEADNLLQDLEARFVTMKEDSLALAKATQGRMDYHHWNLDTVLQKEGKNKTKKTSLH